MSLKVPQGSGSDSVGPRSQSGFAWALVAPLGLRWTVCGVHLALIAVLSLLPAWLFPPAPEGIPGIDKVVHLAMYGVLGLLLRWAADARPAGPAGWGWPLAGAVYGMLMEACQLWLTAGGRSFSWGDAAANLAGVVAAWSAAGWLFPRRGGNG